MSGENRKDMLIDTNLLTATAVIDDAHEDHIIAVLNKYMVSKFELNQEDWIIKLPDTYSKPPNLSVTKTGSILTYAVPDFELTIIDVVRREKDIFVIMVFSTEDELDKYLSYLPIYTDRTSPEFEIRIGEFTSLKGIQPISFVKFVRQALMEDVVHFNLISTKT